MSAHKLFKLTLKYESPTESSPDLTLVLKKLPRKWVDGPVSTLTNQVVKSYVAKHPAEDPPVASNLACYTPEGDLVAASDLVSRVFRPNQVVRIVQGAPRATPLNPVRTEDDSSDDEQSAITTQRKLEKLKKKDAAFDYSKWDRLDLSDDDAEDCHPNIEKASWMRIKAQQREERRATEEATIAKMTRKIKKYSDRVVKLEASVLGGLDAEQEAQHKIDLADAKASLKRHRDELELFELNRKLTVDDVITGTKEERTEVSKKVPVGERAVKGPLTEKEEFDDYDSFVKANKPLLMKFSQLTKDKASEEMMLAHPAILSQHSEGTLSFVYV